MAGADIDMEGTVEQTGGLEDETLDDATVPATQDNMGGDEDEEQNNEQQDAEEADDHDNEDEKPKPNPQTHFLSYLKSPIVHLTIGSGSSATTISAHRAMLTQSPYFASRLNEPTSSTTTNLPDEDLDAMACFLQYQYTGEYFPRRLPNQPDGLEHDPSYPSIDTTGAQLLKHARVYTLAEKLGLPDLKTLAHSKIHRINGTAIGEIAYARYVYGHTGSDDITIRRPVAAFWATRSHVLRHEAEREFKDMCLEFPRFGFDVLTLVLDSREKRQREREKDTDEQAAALTGTPGTQGKGRKRLRPSVNV